MLSHWPAKCNTSFVSRPDMMLIDTPSLRLQLPHQKLDVSLGQSQTLNAVLADAHAQRLKRSEQGKSWLSLMSHYLLNTTLHESYCNGLGPFLHLKPLNFLS